MPMAYRRAGVPTLAALLNTFDTHVLAVVAIQHDFLAFVPRI